MPWPMVRLGEVADWGSGGTPKRSERVYFGHGVPWLSIADLNDGPVRVAKESLTPLGIQNSSAKVVPPGTLLVAMYGSIGKLGIADVELCTSQAIAFAVPDHERVDTRYLFHFLLGERPRLQAKGRGGTQMNIGQADLKAWPMPLPPIVEQRRIADILDRADALRAKRREALTHLDDLTQSIFLDMFGGPALNRRGWPTTPIGQLAVRFSDGPFGSNLKSSDYVDEGVRVVRLQNIGIGEFLDHDRAYISAAHFATLRKHECLPGDVLVGTLGDPNLRACVQPDWLGVALNKADCVQMRVNPELADRRFVCALLNQRSVERMARSAIHGQTRLRISMGRLRELRVPVPPLALQRRFADLSMAIEDRRKEILSVDRNLHELFAVLQQRAFRGAL